jgi:hypothetical protein
MQLGFIEITIGYRNIADTAADPSGTAGETDGLILCGRPYLSYEVQDQCHIVPAFGQL